MNRLGEMNCDTPNFSMWARPQGEFYPARVVCPARHVLRSLGDPTGRTVQCTMSFQTWS